MAKVMIHNPIGKEVHVDQGNTPLPPLGESSVGILENGNANAVVIMNAIVSDMIERYGVVEGANAHFQLAAPDYVVLDDVAARNDWVLVGGAD